MLRREGNKRSARQLITGLGGRYILSDLCGSEGTSSESTAGGGGSGHWRRRAAGAAGGGAAPGAGIFKAPRREGCTDFQKVTYGTGAPRPDPRPGVRWACRKDSVSAFITRAGRVSAAVVRFSRNDGAGAGGGRRPRPRPCENRIGDGSDCLAVAPPYSPTSRFKSCDLNIVHRQGSGARPAGEGRLRRGRRRSSGAGRSGAGHRGSVSRRAPGGRRPRERSAAARRIRSARVERSPFNALFPAPPPPPSPPPPTPRAPGAVAARR
ncbi:hypothetical protein EVAR_68382_1 [Eumeta japonica]|uniref:Uncharacterized protein n=1 Tax=Eumeta variegata TaxID=151549 RepID=A0A4C1ZMC9_EUMVA|nr:hypothetical protein EVAR_68382_1 [Eumeta japonica]